MLKEALQYIVSGFVAETKEIAGQMFSTQPLQTIKQAKPEPLVVHNLSGLVDYLVNNFDGQPPVLIQVASPTDVNVYSTFNRDFGRNHLLQASALLPNIPFEKFLDIEQFNVLLQSCFVPNEHSTALLAVVGNIKDEQVATYGDDGVSQQVTAKVGVATVANIPVPNPVWLKPFRTFVDIAQPECLFVFRMKTGPTAALFEADGGAWRIEAIHDIRDYLTKALEAQIADGKVTIIA